MMEKTKKPTSLSADELDVTLNIATLVLEILRL